MFRQGACGIGGVQRVVQLLLQRLHCLQVGCQSGLLRQALLTGLTRCLRQLAVQVG